MHAHTHPDPNVLSDAPTSGTPARLAFSVGFAALIAVPLTLLAVTAPKFLDIFRDFEIALPSALVWTLNAGMALSNPVWIITATIVAILAAWVVHPILRDRWWKLVLWWLLIGGTMTAALFAYFGYIALTLRSLHDALQTGA